MYKENMEGLHFHNLSPQIIIVNECNAEISLYLVARYEIGVI